jgi:UDP-N-acetylglucosamine 3-dehydrogenase
MERILLIGSKGNMGAKHFRVLEELKKQYDFELKTCDFKSGADYNDYKIAYEEFNPRKVIIATPTETHSELLQYFNGKVYSILVEKPLVDDDSEDYYMITKSKIMVGHIERYNPMVRKIKELLDGKLITHIICLRCGLCQYGPNVVEDRNIDKDLMIHDIDVAQYLTAHIRLTTNKIRRTTTMFTKSIENNQADMLTEINDVKCYFHADKTSPKKIRTIKVL